MVSKSNTALHVCDTSPVDINIDRAGDLQNGTGCSHDAEGQWEKAEWWFQEKLTHPQTKLGTMKK